MTPPVCPNHSGIESRLERVEDAQKILRGPEGSVERLWNETKKKVHYQVFFWIMGGMFSLMILMQSMIYRDIDHILAKMERMSEQISSGRTFEGSK
jgi:hypothetical protein